MLTTIWPDWVIDIAMSRDNLMCFVPYDEEDNLVTGMSYFAERCPGNLVGVYHRDGDQSAVEWTEKNQGWYEKYRREE